MQMITVGAIVITMIVIAGILTMITHSYNTKRANVRSEIDEDIRQTQKRDVQLTHWAVTGTLDPERGPVGQIALGHKQQRSEHYPGILDHDPHMYGKEDVDRWKKAEFERRSTAYRREYWIRSILSVLGIGGSSLMIWFLLYNFDWSKPRAGRNLPAPLPAISTLPPAPTNMAPSAPTSSPATPPTASAPAPVITSPAPVPAPNPTNPSNGPATNPQPDVNLAPDLQPTPDV